tara:strand:- start:1686 stop:3374 length:1689 start_codon:yes stop_codon:yes gene_type:complete
MNNLIPILVALCLALLFSSEATAQAPEPSAQDLRAYAIVVGNNAGGPGQETLRYAEADAKRVLAVLSQLGDYNETQSKLLLTPSPSELWNAFEIVQARLEEDKKQGRESVLFFYYSGHARSSAIDLGPLRISLSDLRARIESMPASLRVVVLDACQSGAISRVKGAKAADDFSTNSISSLSMTGLAIMASSTGAELSQESDSLEGSYFTHHLVSGLRGAADSNTDGAVSLQEVYDYAYHTTLLTTAVSAVGKQHATLETNLRGKGDVALTRPSAANAKLQLPDAVGGAFTVSQNQSVIAEINKPKGHATTVALPAGRYSILVRSSATEIRKCSVKLVDRRTATVDWPACSKVAVVTGVRKGAPGEASAAHFGESGPQWGIEVGLDIRGPSKDAYTDRLETFGYQRGTEFLNFETHIQLKAYRRMGPYLLLGGSVGRLETDSYYRHTDGASRYSLKWSTWHASALARIQKNGFGDLFQFYAEASLGLSRAASTLKEDEMNRTAKETYYGAAVSGSVGVILMPVSYLGLVTSVGYGVAPTLSNELDDTHLGAGLITNIGLRTTF